MEHIGGYQWGGRSMATRGAVKLWVQVEGTGCAHLTSRTLPNSETWESGPQRLAKTNRHIEGTSGSPAGGAPFSSLRAVARMTFLI